MSQVPGNEGSLKSFPRPSYDITNSMGGISMLPGYNGSLQSTYIEMKPDPDEIESTISQLDITGTFIDGGNSGSATLTREPNYDYQVSIYSSIRYHVPRNLYNSKLY